MCLNLEPSGAGSSYAFVFVLDTEIWWRDEAYFPLKCGADTRINRFCCNFAPQRFISSGSIMIVFMWAWMWRITLMGSAGSVEIFGICCFCTAGTMLMKLYSCTVHVEPARNED